MTDTTPAAAWAGLLERLREAGEIVEGPLGAKDDRERAEGYRHVLRVLSIAAEMLLEKGDTSRPAFTRWMSAWRKQFGDNPRTIYDACLLDASLTYRIVGVRGAPTYLGFTVYGTTEDGARPIVGNVDDTDLAFGEAGTFELWLGPSRPDDLPEGAGFLELPPHATDLMVRQYFLDPSVREATYAISAVPDPGPPPPLSEAELSRRLDAVGAYVVNTLEVETTLSALVTSVTPAVLRHGEDWTDPEGRAVDPPLDHTAVARTMPAHAIQYAGSWFDGFGDDERIVVTGTVPDARYWSIQLLTRWMESGDWVHAPVFLTGADVGGEPGEAFTIIAGTTDPGDGTPWLDTDGHRNFNLAVRALDADDQLQVEFSREAG